MTVARLIPVLLIPIIVINVISVVESGTTEESSGRQVLVFGGSGFIGTPIVEALLAEGDQVTIVSRGNWYWDYQHRVLPKVRWIKHDRSEPLETSPELVELLETTSWNAVVDISNEWHGPDELLRSVKAIRGKTDVYVYISTAVVYDVCERGQATSVEEKHAVKPADEETRTLLERHFLKGDKKFRAEQVLREQRGQRGGVPYVLLRLADVIGPRENQHRFWLYQLWVKVAEKLDLPVLMPDFLGKHTMSFVYSEDVAKTVMKILSTDKSKVHDQVFNLAYREGVSFHDFIDSIGTALGIDKVHTTPFNHTRPADFYYYPMERRVLDVSKAQSVLGWAPTPWSEAVKTTVQFNEAAIRDDGHPIQRDEIVQLFMMQHLQREPAKAAQFVRVLEEFYDITLTHFRKHDEL